MHGRMVGVEVGAEVVGAEVVGAEVVGAEVVGAEVGAEVVGVEVGAEVGACVGSVHRPSATISSIVLFISFMMQQNFELCSRR